MAREQDHFSRPSFHHRSAIGEKKIVSFLFFSSFVFKELQDCTLKHTHTHTLKAYRLYTNENYKVSLWSIDLNGESTRVLSDGVMVV